MGKKHKKTKEWKRRQKKIKERKHSKEAIIASKERLLQEVKRISAQDGHKFQIDKSNPLKMSEVIIEFAQPLLDVSQTDEEQRKAITMAIAIWNVSLLPDKDQKNFIREFCNSMQDSASDQEILDENSQIISYFLERKKIFFPDIKRMILDYDCVETPQGFHLNVVSNVLEDK
jgi:hypothetical protein